MAIQAPPAPPKTEEEVVQPAASPGWYQNPTGPGQRYWDGEKWTDSYSQPVQPAPAPPVKGGWPGWVIVLGYFAALVPLAGLIVGIAATTRDERTKRHGKVIIGLSVLMWLIYIIAYAGA